MQLIVVAAEPATNSGPGWVSLGSALVALFAAVLGLGQYLRFRSKRDKQEAVGHAFADVLRGLGSESEVERLASAALTRRFFDRSSEFAVGGLPYADDAVRVISAVLRSEPTGATQKLLADGLRSAPSLAYGDFQRANLRDCYWGTDAPATPLDAHGADFYGADLSSASLRRAILRKAVFREAHLLRTVFNEADCRDADFRGADLHQASFDGSLLLGAIFHNAHRIPEVISANLVPGGVYGSPDPVRPSTDVTEPKDQEHKVFISAPSHIEGTDEVALQQVLIGLRNAGVEPVRLLPQAYTKSAPLANVAKQIRTCAAVVVFGPPQFFVVSADAASADGTHPVAMSTPWNHIEAGIAVGLDKPLLVVRHGANGGVFGIPEHPEMLTVIDTTAPGCIVALAHRVSAWVQAWAPSRALNEAE